MTDTPTPGAAAELPITLQELVAHLRQEAQDFQDLVNEGGSSCPEVALGMAAQRRMWAEAVATLTPHAPAQAQLDALREEVARLTSALTESSRYAGKLLNSELAAIAESNRLRAELAALKARPTDVDALMALAEEMVTVERGLWRGTHTTGLNAAREALRTKLAARKEPT